MASWTIAGSDHVRVIGPSVLVRVLKRHRRARGVGVSRSLAYTSVPAGTGMAGQERLAWPGQRGRFRVLLAPACGLGWSGRGLGERGQAVQRFRDDLVLPVEPVCLALGRYGRPGRRRSW